MDTDNRHIKVLIIATSRHTRGGITSVLKTYQQSALWDEFSCKWLESHCDKNLLVKLYYFISSFIQALYYIPTYDIVHIHTSRPGSVIRKLPYILYARLWKKKVISHLHFFETHVVFSKRYKNLYRLLSRLSHKIIVLSERCKKEYTGEIFPAEKMCVIYNPITTIQSTTTYQRKKQILFAGLLIPDKGYKDLIQAFASIAHEYPDWQLVLAGSGEIAEAQELACQLNISSQTLLPGWIGGEEKNRYFSQASIFCLPSYSEGFPMVILEAWGCKTPTVTTPVGGLPDVLIENENALVFTPGDIPTLASHLKRLISDETLRKHIADKSHSMAITKFATSAIYNDIKRLYINTLRQI